MTNEASAEPSKPVLHFVGRDAQQRAAFARGAMRIGYHCELYDDLVELSDYAPTQGLVFVDEAASGGGIGAVISRLEGLGIWLPVIAVGERPSPHQIVEAIKAGALDFLVTPVEDDRLERCIIRNLHDIERLTAIRRSVVEARQKITRLSVREYQVLDLLSAGQSNKAIARNLGISPRTVEIHRSNMMQKLGALHSSSAVRIRLEAGPLAQAS